MIAGPGFGVQVAWVWGKGFMIEGSGFMVEGVGFRAEGVT